MGKISFVMWIKASLAPKTIFFHLPIFISFRGQGMPLSTTSCPVSQSGVKKSSLNVLCPRTQTQGKNYSDKECWRYSPLCSCLFTFFLWTVCLFPVDLCVFIYSRSVPSIQWVMWSLSHLKHGQTELSCFVRVT